MDYSYKVQMKQKLKEMFDSGKFQDRRVTIFGSNEPAEQMITFLGTLNIQVEFLLDNNKKKVGGFFNGIPIKKPEDVLGKFQNDILILIISKHYYEMLEQLQNFGYQENIHIIKVVNISSFASNSLSEKTFELYKNNAILGENIYYNIKLKYPEMDYLFILPVRAIGDVFLGAYYAADYIVNNGISNPVFVVAEDVSKKAVMALEYDKVVSITLEEMGFLERFYLLSTDEYPIIEVNHQKPYTCLLRRIGNYKKLDFASLFCYGIYELKGEVKGRKLKKNRWKIAYTKEVFTQYNLQENKTVILAPYAKAAARIEMQFWECLAENLKEKGYIVCTNIAGAEEIAITGTQPFSFSLEYAKEVLETAGYFIGLRSGFCDLVSQAECKKVIFYPDRIYATNEFIDFFSLSNMGLADDVTEIVFYKEKQQEILNQVLALF